jgi:hypothetical protein
MASEEMHEFNPGESFFERNDRNRQIVSQIQNSRDYLFVPQHWAIRVSNNRKPEDMAKMVNVSGGVKSARTLAALAVAEAKAKQPRIEATKKIIELANTYMAIRGNVVTRKEGLALRLVGHALEVIKETVKTQGNWHTRMPGFEDTLGRLKAHPKE